MLYLVSDPDGNITESVRAAVIIGYWRQFVAAFEVSEKFRFLVIGVYNTGFGYLSFLVLVLLLADHLHYLIILLISHFLAVSNAFIGHRWLVFRSTGPLFKEFARFNASYLGLLAFNMLALPLALPLAVEVAHAASASRAAPTRRAVSPGSWGCAA